MTLAGDTSALAFDLSKVPSPEAAPRLQALTLSLAERVCNLERRLAGTVCVGTLLFLGDMLLQTLLALTEMSWLSLSCRRDCHQPHEEHPASRHSVLLTR